LSTNQAELVRVCQELGVPFSVLEKSDAQAFIQSAIGKFMPAKTSGHLSIGGDAVALPLEEHEFTYSENLPNSPVIVFFDQENHNRGMALRLSDGRVLGRVMGKSFGMEYFVTDPNLSFLLAVNWYAIEGTGVVEQWMTALDNVEET